MFIGAALLVRVAFMAFARVDSDEPQHLHVAWAWSQGLVQYRDVFDNHMPLFHLLTAPFVAIAGERTDILFWLRLPMLALFALVLWATFVIARQVWDARIAAWSVVLLSLFPPFFLKSLEFRNDNLWTALWMAALIALLRRRMFIAGLLLGAAFAVSLKTAVLVVALVIAGAIVWFFGGRGVAARDAATSAGAGRRRSARTKKPGMRRAFSFCNA